MSEHYQALPAGFRFDEYEIEGVLGTGGFGITYLGHDHNLGHKVAIKEYLPGDLAVRVPKGSDDGTMSAAGPSSVLPKSPSDKDTFEWGLNSFLDEARTLALFSHPNLIRVLRFFRAHGTACIVMEYAEGETLGKRLLGGGTLSETELRRLLLPLLDGLEAVHAAGYLHRDIKPGNIIIRPDGSPVLLDFGAARQAIGGKTKTLTSVLSPGYAPIEQYSFKSKQGPWTDLYALGALCYRAITGKMPEAATDRVYDDPLEGWTKDIKGYDADFLRAIDCAMKPKAHERPQSVDEWRRMMTRSDAQAATRLASKQTKTSELETIMAEKPVAAKPGKPGTGKNQLRAGAAAILIGVIAVVAYLVWPTVTENAGQENSGQKNSSQGTNLTAANVSARLAYIAQNWQAAELSRQSIENDLKITLASMEAAGMDEDVALVKRAINDKESAIAGYRTQAVQAMIEIAESAGRSPELVDQTIQRFIDKSRAELRPRGGEVAERFGQALKQFLAQTDDNVTYFYAFWDSRHEV